MAHSLSSKKRIRQTAKANARNRWRKDQIKGSIKGFNAALTGGDLDKAQTALNDAAATLARVASHGTIHKNTAARQRSRLARKLNAVKKAGTGTKAANA